MPEVADPVIEIAAATQTGPPEFSVFWLGLLDVVGLGEFKEQVGVD